MITITDTAVRKAKELLIASKKQGWGLRIYQASGGCCGPSYGMDIEDKAGADDEVIENEGLKLFMDKETAFRLKDMQIDYLDDGFSEGFVINSPMPPSCKCPSCK